MSDGNVNHGQQGMSGNAEMSVKKQGGGDATPVTDNEEQLLVKALGEDGGNTTRRLLTDNSGRLSIDVSTDSVGLFKTSDFTEARNVRELQNATGLNHGSASVGTSATSIASSQSVPDGKTVTVQSVGTNGAKVYIGGSGVTTGNGIELKAGGQASGIEVDDPSKIYAIAASGTQDLRWFYEG